MVCNAHPDYQLSTYWKPTQNRNVLDAVVTLGNWF